MTTRNVDKRSAVIEENEIDPYVIKHEIGKGSFATVYRGFHKDTRNSVAIKTVSRTILTPKLVDNLESEINILKQLRHKHVTELIEILKGDRFIFLIMEDCTGGDLSGYLKRRGRVETLQYVPEPGAAPIYYPHARTGGLDVVVVRSFLRQLARALKFLRGKNLIHRDIKPQNLLLMPADESDYEKGHPRGVPILKIADFGFARFLPNTMMAETLCGSPLYMAPEILRYEKYDAKADLWSVGAVLFEISVGRPPFKANNHIELLKKIEQSNAAVRFPDEEDPKAAVVPVDVKKLIRSLLKRQPVERASFDEFFASQAMANSKFPPPNASQSSRPQQTMSPTPLVSPLPSNVVKPHIPSNHRIIPPEVLDPKALVPPSTFNFRRANSGQSTTVNEGRRTSSGSGSVAIPSPNRNGYSPGRNGYGSPATSPKPSPLRKPITLSTIAGEHEDAGEYVVVGDTRRVEFDQRVDELNAARQRAQRRPSTGIEAGPRTSPGTSPKTLPGTSYSPRRPPLSMPPSDTRIQLPPTPSEIDTNVPRTAAPLTPTRAASSALSRALNMATKRLFGTQPQTSHSPTSTTVNGTPGSSHGAYPPTPGYGQRNGSKQGSPQWIPQLLPQLSQDPKEEALLAELENRAQKAEVITRWADELFENVKAFPLKPLPDPTTFVAREDEDDRQAKRRRNSYVDAEHAAVNCVALYILMMQFAQDGLDQLRKFMDLLDERGMPYPTDGGFDDALDWFTVLFEKCNERAQLVRSWLSEDQTPELFLDQLLYERALNLSRKAARKEIFDQGAQECQAMYQDSLWVLYTLRDDLNQQQNPYFAEDQSTIETWITRTKLRLHRCKRRAAMSEQDRRKDAQADQNLDDVNRFPPPWELKPENTPPSPSQPLFPFLQGQSP